MTSTAHVTESHLLTLARTAGQDAGRAGFIIPDGQSGHVLQFLTDQLVRIGKAQRWRDPAGYATAMISNAYDKGYEETRSATAEDADDCAHCSGNGSANCEHDDYPGDDACGVCNGEGYIASIAPNTGPYIACPSCHGAGTN